MHVHDVMEVEKTVSPKMLRGAPNERPANDWPVFRCKTAGIDDPGIELAWVANPRERRADRNKLRARIPDMLALMTEQRENEVAEVAINQSIHSALNLRKRYVLVASVLRENHVRAKSLRLSRGARL